MAGGFIGEEFLLHTRWARRLYHDHAASLPIFDYHCHLPVRDIAENRRFDSLTQAWLAGDHYKWRAMRACGAAEHLVTGNASDLEKFEAWAAVVPATIGNPLFHWTHLELLRYFGVRDVLGPGNARAIHNQCSALLAGDSFRARGLLEKMNVRVICTTDDPADCLEYHAALAADPTFPIMVVPAFRPDPALAIDQPERFNAWIARLEQAANTRIDGYDEFLAALRARHDSFHAAGCRISDYGIEEPYADGFTGSVVREAFHAARNGITPYPAEARAFKSAVLLELARMDARAGWAWQLHMSALRDANSRASARLGPNTGFDTIGDFPIVRPLARLLDRLDSEGALPKTILYSLNPASNAELAALIGCFSGEGVPGKMQLGSAWWFNDQKAGMEDHLRTLASIGLLPRFVGMLTDSRSFLSFPRHEYFRRILCSMLGGWMEQGEIPRDMRLVGGMVEDICWNNAAAYFGIAEKSAKGTASASTN
jgi:glucuronate isomerase